MTVKEAVGMAGGGGDYRGDACMRPLYGSLRFHKIFTVGYKVDMNERVIRFKPQVIAGRVSQADKARVVGWMRPTPVGVQSRVRIWPFAIMVGLVGMFLFARLAQLTLVEGHYRRELANGNRVIALRREPTRGVFLDRNGVAIVNNIPIYKRQVPGTTVAQGQFEEIDHQQAVELSRDAQERVFFDAKREYLCGKACALLIGYVGEVDKKEVEAYEDYEMGDSIGKAGLEKVYEKLLRGTPGSELVEVDARGQLVREIGREYPMPGTNISLTVDEGLQRVLYEALGERRGAAVAQDPKTGAVLAMVSSPAFDAKEIGKYLMDEDMPFFNRAISGAYPPGSIFKIVTAVAGLEEGVVDKETTYEDTGEIVIDDYSFGNWYFHDYGRTEGHVNVIDALRRSNDIYFYQLGGALGANKLAEWARMMGFEDQADLAGLGAVKGTIPDPAWKERVKGERWYLGNTYHMSIGQGDVLTTPLQLNRMLSVIAAGGILCPVELRLDEVGRHGCEQLNLEMETLTVVREGLKQACEPGGTGVPFFEFEPRVGCKTGTAQYGGENTLPHAWFSAYAPMDNPEIAITVLVEHAGQGSEKAAPVAREAMEYWFHDDRGIDEEALFNTETDQE